MKVKQKTNLRPERLETLGLEEMKISLRIEEELYAITDLFDIV